MKTIVAAPAPAAARTLTPKEELWPLFPFFSGNRPLNFRIVYHDHGTLKKSRSTPTSKLIVKHPFQMLIDSEVDLQ